MKSNRIRFLCLLAVTLSLTAIPARASDPVGVYAIVEKVTLEPSDSAPERIQIWGVFALSDAKRGDGYLPARRGYLYYALRPGKEAICRKEWNDLKTVAGTGQGIGFGGRYEQNGRVRKAGEKAQAPDTYPMMMGVTRMASQHNQPGILTELKNALSNR